MRKDKTNVVLIGMMGCGKTTIAKLLKDKLHKQWIDMDQYIEDKYQMSISQMFDISEDYFRERETACCLEIAQLKDCIISTGGGVIQRYENMEALKQSGYTDEIEGLIQDVDLCSKTAETRKKAHELKDWYYPVRAGELAPEIEAEDENGKTVKLADYRGKIVFLDVWATWCGGCVEGLPYFIALREKYKERKDIVFLTLTIDEDSWKENWKKFLKEKKFSGKIPHLFPTNREAFEKSYCITGIPRYILIDKEGKIVNAWHVSAKHEYFSFMFDTELLTLE